MINITLESSSAYTDDYFSCFFATDYGLKFDAADKTKQVDLNMGYAV